LASLISSQQKIAIVSVNKKVTGISGISLNAKTKK
jgi:hypothetical protein